MVKKILLPIAVLVSSALLLWPGLASPAHATDLSASLQKIIAASCASEQPPGVAVQSLKDGRLILNVNSQKLYTPASNVKIITSVAAMKKLKPDYTFKTIFYVDGAIKDGVLHGNLYVKGFGDPDLVPEQVWRMAVDLANSGIHTVSGDLVADDSFLDDQLRAPNWDNRRGPSPSNSPIGALSVNFNTVSIRVLPGSNKGDKAIVYMDPKNFYLRLENSATTGAPNTRSTIIVDRIPNSVSDVARVQGAIPLNSRGQKHFVNISNPTLYALSVFHEMIQGAGVTVKGLTRAGRTPDNATQYLVHESRPLSLIVWGLNKFSNNFMAEQILKTMGAEIKGRPGTFSKGLEVAQEYLSEIGIKPGAYTLVDGSGLSAENQLSPAQLIRVLEVAYKDFELGPEFVASLALMGEDASLAKRLRNSPAQGNVRAKTGTLNGVTALSGYAHMPGTGPVAFSILINGKRCDRSQAKRLQDKILLLLFGQS